MSGFLLAIAFLLGLVIALNLALRANPATASKVIRYGGATLLTLGGLAFAFTGRFGFAVPLFVFSYWLVGKPFSKGRGPGVGGMGRFGSRPKSSGQTSEVETAFLSMRLNHDSGELSGVVSAGNFLGLDLAVLSLDELLSLLTEVANDEDSVRLLQTYLDRVKGPEWRDAYDGAAGRAPSGPMTRDRACEILGVSSTASASEIRAAYKTLMLKLHPDHGGSTHLAAEVNAAKDFLLGE
jgi:DnaJ-domain-containing protein 1